MDNQEQPQLDSQTRTVIENILKKQPEELNDNDRAILRARWSYMGLFMGKRSQARYQAVLDKPNEEVQAEQESNDTPDHTHPGDVIDDGADE
jgi:hypothetical protein